MATLPYLASPGNLPKALQAIKRAATPPKVSQDFVKTKLGIPGSSGDQMTSYLKRIGFAAPDGSPTALYKKFRTQSGGQAVAEALRIAYAPLYDLNEYMHECSDKELRDLIIQETGQEVDARPVALILSTIKALINAADFSEEEVDSATAPDENLSGDRDRAQLPVIPNNSGGTLGLNIGYTINLNLPETTDIEVFNAIFKSLRQHLLGPDDV